MFFLKAEWRSKMFFLYGSNKNKEWHFFARYSIIFVYRSLQLIGVGLNFKEQESSSHSTEWPRY